ncbi:MAG: response regulator [Terrimicrobiaceae bacterium]|nr:response regulator [Terrimicrobiaceae bacterium]
MTSVPNSDGAAILLVDDSRRNLLALESLLEGGDFETVKAQSSDEALLALMSRDFAAIVLDVQMPDVDGIELARLIKERKRTQHIPILFLTAHYREEQHAVVAYDVGAVDYLTKPIHPAVLRSKINVFVDLFRKNRALEALNSRLEEQNLALQREAEERSRRIRAEADRAEAESANAAKDRFLAVLSHELRTPLTPIVYAVAMLENSPDCPPHLREALEIISRNVRMEVRLIDDLLDLARVRNGKLKFDPQPVDLHVPLREAIRVCLDEAKNRNIAVDENLAAPIREIHGDPARLQQIFWNLISNAVKFTPDNGRIMVRTFNQDNRFVAEVEDRGAGIEAGKLGKIFDPFEQGAEGSVGLGLGLSISKALVVLHGGVISVTSAGPGQGSCFRVEFPGRPASPPLNAPSGKPDRDSVPLRILLAEDHADTAQCLTILLGTFGHQVRVAYCVREALEIAQTFDFDVLISDIGLPDGRGTELLTKLRSGRSPLLGAIAMTGFGMERDLEASERAGFAVHLTKPVECDALREALSNLCTRNGMQAAGMGTP